jgi:hypothetical protein
MRRLHALDALGALLVVGWAVAWTYGILHRYFDHDELEHLYAAWRIGRGDRPFYDFFQDHPPFLWYALAPALPWLGRISFPLFPLRFLSAAGHLVLLVALGRNVSLSLARLPAPEVPSRRPFVVAALVFAGHLSVIWYLLEFRLDAWPNAILFLAIHHDRREAAGPFRGAFLLALVAGLTLVCSPKLAAFFALFCAFSVAAATARLRRTLGLAAGMLAAGLLGVLFLRAAGLDPRLVYRLCVTYHAILSAKGGFGHGLWAAILEQAELVAILVASIAGWLLCARGRMRAFSFELAILSFLLVQAAFVSVGYPQYYAPWFLLGMTFVPYLELGLRRVPRAHRLVLATGFLLAGANVFRDLRAFTSVDQTAPVVAFNAWAHERVPPGATVAGDIMRLPIFRRSVFYYFAGSRQPNGFPAQAALTEMGLDWIAARMTPAAYDRQLEAGRPTLIIPSRLLSPLQDQAIARYRVRHAAELRVVASPMGAVQLRL